MFVLILLHHSTTSFPSGFKIIDAYEIDTQGGSLRLVCKKLSTNLKTSKRFIKLLDAEKKLGYSEVEFYESIAKSVQTKVDKINKFFQSLYEKNQKYYLLELPREDCCNKLSKKLK